MYTKLVSPIFSYETKRLVFEKMRFHKKVVGVAFLYTSANNRGEICLFNFAGVLAFRVGLRIKFEQLWTFCELDKDWALSAKRWS